MTIRLEYVGSISLAVVRRQVKPGALGGVIPECCGIVWNALKAQGVKGGRNVAVYWDGSIRLEVGVEIDAPFAERDGLTRSGTPGGTVASATHFGPYGTLGAAHRAVLDWVKANNRRLAGPSWEIYGHWQNEWNADPSKIRTDVCYLLEDQS
jgi:effector-binding domain-containing protein